MSKHSMEYGVNFSGGTKEGLSRPHPRKAMRESTQTACPLINFWINKLSCYCFVVREKYCLMTHKSLPQPMNNRLEIINVSPPISATSAGQHVLERESVEGIERDAVSPVYCERSSCFFGVFDL